MSFANWPENAPIHELQVLLRTVERENELKVDGIFGEETEAALKEFQKAQGMAVTGVADEETWNALRDAYAAARVVQGPAEPLCIVLQPGQVIQKGSANLHLPLMQAMLFALGRLLIEVPPVRMTGVLDEETQQAVRWLQALAGLEITGEIDKRTWRALARQYRLTIGDGSGSFPVRSR